MNVVADVVTTTSGHLALGFVFIFYKLQVSTLGHLVWVPLKAKGGDSWENRVISICPGTTGQPKTKPQHWVCLSSI